MAEPRSNFRLMAAMILAIFLYGAIAALLGTLLPDLAERFNASDQALGVMATIQAIGLAISSVAVGPLIDNKGKKTALVLGLALIVIALLGLGFSPSFGFAQLSIFLLGLGGGMIVTGANTLISDVAEERRSSALNLLNLFFGVGSMSTPFLAANIPGLETSYALCYTLAALAGLTFLLHATTPMPGPTGERGFRFSEAGTLFGQPALWLLSAFLFLYVACEVGVFNWLVRYLVSQGVDQSFAQNVLTFGFAMGIAVGRIVISRVLLGVSEVKVTFWAALGMVLFTFAMLRSADPMMVGLTAFFAGLSMAPMFPTTLGMVGNIFRVATATAMGIVITSGWIGLTLSSYLIGAISEAVDLRTALLLIPGMSLGMVLINLALRPYVRRPA